ncbi:MAG: LysR family transcriptional regulator [Tissierellia bacterium]|nr:LysR family transcriptional regulator [Tissierellia bacterium]
MNIRQLRIFKKVCEEGSITKAAESLFISQPAVSNAINELEEYLKISLFDRISRGIQLNETGRLFLTKTVRLLELYDDLEENIKKLEENATIKIGSSITIANFILPKLIYKFKTICKDTPINITVDNARKIEDLIIENKIDLGLVEGVIYNNDLISIPFSSYELVGICSPRHRFSKERSIDVSSLIDVEFLLREKGSAIRDTFDSALLLHGISINPIWTSVNSGAIIEAVKKNLGISILPRDKVRREIEAGEISEIKIEGLELKNTNHIIFHKDKYKTRSMMKLIGIIQGYDGKLSKRDFEVDGNKGKTKY